MNSSTRENAILVLSGLIVLGFGGVVITWIMFPPVERNDLLVSLVTTLGSGYLLVLNYWFTRTPAEPPK